MKKKLNRQLCPSYRICSGPSKSISLKSLLSIYLLIKFQIPQMARPICTFSLYSFISCLLLLSHFLYHHHRFIDWRYIIKRDNKRYYGIELNEFFLIYLLINQIFFIFIEEWMKEFDTHQTNEIVNQSQKLLRSFRFL